VAAARVENAFAVRALIATLAEQDGRWRGLGVLAERVLLRNTG
jgi:hypothetical protein